MKLEWENPTGSMKDRMAQAVITRAEQDGRLKPGDTVVEYTGGSTGASLALVCAARGYLLADPNRLPAIEIAFLNGVDRPTVEKTDADFTTLGIQFRGYIDFGVREQDHRGAVKFKGEA